jgi:hypothetical protein
MSDDLLKELRARIKKLEQALDAMIWAYPYEAPCHDWLPKAHAHNLADAALKGKTDE